MIRAIRSGPHGPRAVSIEESPHTSSPTRLCRTQPPGGRSHHSDRPDLFPRVTELKNALLKLGITIHRIQSSYKSNRSRYVANVERGTTVPSRALIAHMEHLIVAHGGTIPPSPSPEQSHITPRCYQCGEMRLPLKRVNHKGRWCRLCRRCRHEIEVWKAYQNRRHQE